MHLAEQFGAARGEESGAHGLGIGIRAEELVELREEGAALAGGLGQLVDGPLHQDAGRVVAGEEEHPEIVARLLQEPRRQLLRPLEAQRQDAAGAALAARGDHVRMFLTDHILHEDFDSLCEPVLDAITPPVGAGDTRTAASPKLLGDPNERLQKLVLLARNLSLEVLAHRNFANDVKRQIRGVLFEREFLARLGKAVQMIQEEFGFVQNDRKQGEKMSRGEPRTESFALPFPVVTLTGHTVINKLCLS